MIELTDPALEEDSTCAAEAQAVELARAERALSIMQRTGLDRPVSDDEATRAWQEANDDHRQAIQAYTRIARACCRH